jgi:serine protease AprX
MARPVPARRAHVCLLASVVGAAALAVSSPAHAATQTTAAAAVLDPILTTAGPDTPAIVQARPGAAAAASAAAQRAGGTVGQALPMVDGFEVRGDAETFSRLAGSPDVVAITLDTVGHFTASTSGSAGTSSPFTVVTGAKAGWQSGLTGQGVGVAVLDTGVANTPDLSGRVVYGPDLSGEGTTIDSYGHGTVMAGIAAGNGSAARTAGLSDDRRGIAPKATVVAVKVAGRNGAVDVSTVLQGMHWVSAYKSQFNIRVLNLSYGTRSTQDPAYDPLNYAVERLWQQGIVVVVAAGNSGPTAGTITKPGDDPMVLTVGAYDDKGDTRTDNDGIPAWSSQGPTAQGLNKPDVVAPGRTLIAPRAFGSSVEVGNPSALVSPSYIKGSGTSQATAVTSGLAALLIQARPTWTPDQVKRALVSSASPLPGAPAGSGTGSVNLQAALAADPGAGVQQQPMATGLGSLEQSRGGMHVSTDCGNDGTIDEIAGEIDARCEAWNGSAWTGSAWTGSAWTGSAWTGSAWTGSAWTGSAWTGSAWTGSAWTGGTWTGSAWTGSAWTGSAWTGSAWTGSAWTGSAWTGSAWTGSAWTGSAWTSADDPEFMTAWWGNKPRHGKKVRGEKAEDEE